MRSQNVTPINMGYTIFVKTTLEIPDSLFRKAKSSAAHQGISMRELFTGALEEKLRVHDEEKPWLKLFGGLRGLRSETTRLSGILEEEFGQVEAADWQ